MTTQDPPAEFWIHLRYQHFERPVFWVWSIPSSCLLRAMRLPPLLGARTTPSKLLAMVAEGLASTFEAEHGDPSHQHLHADQFDLGSAEATAASPALAWGLIRSGKRRARGWGPAKTVSWIGSQLSANFPGMPPAFGPYPDAVFPSKLDAQASFMDRLSGQARSAMEARDLASESPVPTGRKAKTPSL